MTGSTQPPPGAADELVEGIAKALSDGEMKAVERPLRLLAVVDPERAQAVVDTMRLELALAADQEAS